MLVIMEDGDLHPLAQFLLDIEALRRLDVFQVDATEGWLQAGNDFNQTIRVVLADFQVKHVNIGKLLEEDALTFHHRLGGQRANVAQPQHRRAVGDHAHQVGTRGERGHLIRTSHNLLTGSGDARRISHGQVILVG